jgi:D-glycero-D-manno-heptose 1,7-bisphosphate phosphatase
LERFVLLDRDGVINRRMIGGYITSWEEFDFLPGALRGLRLLAKSGFRTIVVSNQAGVGKGLIRPGALEELTRRFVQRTGKYGGRIHAVYYCPHRPEDACDCRKPKPGLLLKAQAEHKFRFADACLIGDSEGDLLAARAVGCPAVLIGNGEPIASDRLSDFAYRVFPNLYAAARYIVRRPPRFYGSLRMTSPPTRP